MGKKAAFVIILSLNFSLALYAQHTVGDVRQYGGWYSVRFEVSLMGNISILVTQHYPSGEELEVAGDAREQLPLYLKVLSLSIIEEMGILPNFFGITPEDTIVDEDGIFMQLTDFSFSFTFIFNFTRTEEEILYDLRDEIEIFGHMRWP